MNSLIAKLEAEEGLSASPDHAPATFAKPRLTGRNNIGKAQ